MESFYFKNLETPDVMGKKVLEEKSGMVSGSLILHKSRSFPGPQVLICNLMGLEQMASKPRHEYFMNLKSLSSSYLKMNIYRSACYFSRKETV